MAKKKIIFDLDGTLALIDHRRHLVEKSIAYNIWFDQLHPDRNRSLVVQHPPDRIMKIFESETGWKPMWDEFYEQCDKDEPNTPVIEVFKRLHDFELIIFSGRSESVRVKTEKWLHKHDIKPSTIYMRPAKDYTPDDELKRWWLKEEGGAESIFCVFDDRQKVVDMWRSMGITCFQVAPGNF